MHVTVDFVPTVQHSLYKEEKRHDKNNDARSVWTGPNKYGQKRLNRALQQTMNTGMNDITFLSVVTAHRHRLRKTMKGKNHSSAKLSHAV
jgi:hypothetical protein